MVDGVVLDRKITLGQVIQPADTVFEIADLTHLWLLADVPGPDGTPGVCDDYGVWQEKSMYGKKYMGVERTTFVIDPAGQIATVFTKVKPAGHAADVMAAIG